MRVTFASQLSTHFDSPVSLHDMKHSVFGVKLEIFILQILEYEVIGGAEGIRVGFPLRLAGNLDHVAGTVGLDVVAFLVQEVVSLHAPVHVAGADHSKPEVTLTHLCLCNCKND